MTLKWGLLNPTISKSQNSPHKHMCLPKHSVHSSFENQKFEKVVNYFNMTVLPSWGKEFKTSLSLDYIFPVANSPCVSLNAHKTFVRILYFKNTDRLILKVIEIKFCLNALRQHKSNGIYFVVDIAKFNFSQRCLDQLCCGLQSSLYELDQALIFS